MENPPVRQQDDPDYKYEAELTFFFEFQFAYNNHRPQFINALIKFGSLLVYFYFFWAFCSYLVKFWFYRELNAAIIKVDYEVQQSEGMLPQRIQQSQDRFRE